MITESMIKQAKELYLELQEFTEICHNSIDDSLPMSYDQINLLFHLVKTNQPIAILHSYPIK